MLEILLWISKGRHSRLLTLKSYFKSINYPKFFFDHNNNLLRSQCLLLCVFMENKSNVLKNRLKAINLVLLRNYVAQFTKCLRSNQLAIKLSDSLQSIQENFRSAMFAASFIRFMLRRVTVLISNTQSLSIACFSWLFAKDKCLRYNGLKVSIVSFFLPPFLRLVKQTALNFFFIFDCKFLFVHSLSKCVDFYQNENECRMKICFNPALFVYDFRGRRTMKCELNLLDG